LYLFDILPKLKEDTIYQLYYLHKYDSKYFATDLFDVFVFRIDDEIFLLEDKHKHHSHKSHRYLNISTHHIIPSENNHVCTRKLMIEKTDMNIYHLNVEIEDKEIGYKQKGNKQKDILIASNDYVNVYEEVEKLFHEYKYNQPLY